MSQVTVGFRIIYIKKLSNFGTSSVSTFPFLEIFYTYQSQLDSALYSVFVPFGIFWSIVKTEESGLAFDTYIFKRETE